MSITFRSGIDKNAPGTQWLWKDRLVANTLNLIDGRKGTGKSSVVSAILGSWHNGTMPDGSKPHKKLRRVLWFSSEEDYDGVIAPRLRHYGIKTNDVLTLDTRSASYIHRLNLESHYNQIKDTIIESKVDAVVVDPYTELKGSGFSSKDDAATRDYLTMMITLAKLTKSTWFLMRHLRKARSTYALDEGAGSVQIAATCRSVTRCDYPDSTKMDRYYSVLSCNLAAPTFPVQYQIEFAKCGIPVATFGAVCQISVEEMASMNSDAESRDVLSDAKKLLIRCLEEGKTLSVEIMREAESAVIGKSTLRKAKFELGIVARPRLDPSSGKVSWHWCMPDDGNFPDEPKKS